MLPPCANLIAVELLFPIAEADPESRLQLLYDRLAARFGFDPARVRLSRRKLTGGEIVYGYGPPHRIVISAHLAPPEQEDTLRHEAAHAWAFRLDGPRSGHGRLFRRLSRTLGREGRRRPRDSGSALFSRKADPMWCTAARAAGSSSGASAPSGERASVSPATGRGVRPGCGSFGT